MSTFICPLVKIPGHGKHKNADTLRITQIEGSVCIFKEGGFQTGDFAVFTPVDALVPLAHPAFAWLKDPQRPNKTHHRTKALRLRGVFSDGFLTPINELGLGPVERIEGDKVYFAVDANGDQRVLQLGQDCSTLLGITKYEEKVLPGMDGKEEAYGPDVPVYDIEPWKKYKGIFEDPNEVVVITEKLHGTNSRFVYKDGRLWVGSRNRFLYQEERNMWWAIAAAYGLEEKLKAHPNLVLYGETYGDVQDLKYGHDKGVREFAAFDAYDMEARRYLDWDEFQSLCQQLDVPTVPVLYVGPIDDGNGLGSMVESLTNPTDEGPAHKSAVDNKTIREGVVVKPVKERWNYSTHRTILKNVSQAYLLRKGGTEAH